MKRHYVIAVFSVLYGVAWHLILYFLAEYGRVMGSTGAGAPVPVPSVTKALDSMLFFNHWAYFGGLLLASLFLSRGFRKILASVAHVALLLLIASAGDGFSAYSLAVFLLCVAPPVFLLPSIAWFYLLMENEPDQSIQPTPLRSAAEL
jgi:hypothetical protein